MWVETHSVVAGSHFVFLVWETVSPPPRRLIKVSEAARHAGRFDRDSEARAAHCDAGSWKYSVGRHSFPVLEQALLTHDSKAWRAPGARDDSCSDCDAAVYVVAVAAVPASPGKSRHAWLPLWTVAVPDEWLT